MSSKEEEVEIVEQHIDTNSKASPNDDDLFVIDQVGANSKASPNGDDVLVIDQVGANSKVQQAEVEIVEQHTDTNSRASPNADNLSVIDQVGANSKVQQAEVEIVEQHADTNSKASPNDDDLSVIDQVRANSKASPNDEDLFIIDQVGTNSKVSPNNEDLFVIDQVGDKQICTDADQKCESAKSDAPDSDKPEEKPVLEAVDGLFRLDTTPEASKSKTLGPRYRREFDNVMKSEGASVPEGKPVSKGDNRCFNCLGDHSVSNCPLPKNQQQISKNRKAFLSSQGRDRQNQTRYHVEKKNKYSHLKPGVISEALRDAMGLRNRDIPLFIYQMRIHGYPPGWVEEMKEDMTEINIIESSQDAASSQPKTSFDVEKIIDYPGFNVPAGPHFRDDWQYLNFPPMLPVHSKECFAQQLMHYNFMSRRTEIPPVPEPPVSSEPVDMEESSVDSIEELESRRKALLAELESEDSNENGKEAEVPFPCDKETKEDNTNSNDSPVESDWKSLKSPSHGHCRHQEMGTPVSIRFSPYSALPDREKFSRDMGEMIPFENLPNSTGTFQKMKSLLDKVRNLFKRK